MRLNKILFFLLVFRSFLFGFSFCTYPAISYDNTNGANTSLENFKKSLDKKVSDVEDRINKTKTNVEKMIKIQKEKYVESSITQSLVSQTLAEIKKSNYLQTKQNKIRQAKLDLQINKLNSKIIELELLLAQLKK